jgi:hypothetical protein
MKKPKTVPTHADEIDVLRLHNAYMQMLDAKRVALAAEEQFAHHLAAAEKKYGFKHPAEGIDFATRAINRVKHGE